MKTTCITVFAALVTLAAAGPQDGYGSDGGGGYGGGNSGYSDGGFGGYSYAPAVAPIVQRHIYVHAAPPEVDDRTPHPPQQFAPPKKHYKIVFIKAPTPPAPTVPVLPVVPQDSEKTLIYVLVKKPEDQPPIVVPTPAPTQPAKPEVYFIKYKTQKETEAVYGADVSSPASPVYGSPSPSPSAGHGAPSTVGSY